MNKKYLYIFMYYLHPYQNLHHFINLYNHYLNIGIFINYYKDYYLNLINFLKHLYF